MIRLARSSDAAQILNIYAPLIRNTAITFEYEIPDVGDFEKRIEKTSKFYPYLVWEEHKNILGYTYATRFRERKAYDWICESAIYISEQARGKGIGQKLYLKLFECLRAQGIVSVIAIVRPHAKTVDFHEALGFRKAGVIPFGGYKLGEWHEAGFWQLVLCDPVPLSPAPVVPFPQVSHLISFDE
ncbi:MAG: N-acetyltransferase [Calditrichaeota bacterium]|nr:N-acetyltransferase [Calditrichota bacterium]MCB9369689.1 N-acetyltransferase [Calditrichota bacterium]